MCVCVGKWCVSKWCVSKWCVGKWCVVGGGTAGGGGEGGGSGRKSTTKNKNPTQRCGEQVNEVTVENPYAPFISIYFDVLHIRNCSVSS